MSQSLWLRPYWLKSCNLSRLHLLSPLLTTALALSLVGCASGAFSTSSPTPPAPAPQQPANPPSLPPLAAPTPVNTYVGTQIPGPFAATPENIVTLNLNSSNSSYKYLNIPLPDSPSNPVSNSTGLSAPWYDFWDLADTSGVTGLPGAQQFGLSIEQSSRFSFFVSSSTQQIAALVPQQNSACITPTASATYEYITLFGPAFVPATDTAYGTVELAASGSNYTFSNAHQYTESSTPATTGLNAFSPASCTQSASTPGLGYSIDSPASSANGNTEMRSFLGPTGILVANLQGSDSSGAPLPLPGILGTIQPTSAVDLSQVTASSTLYRALEYQPAGPVPSQYGYFGHSDSLLGGTPIVDSSGLNGGWQNPASPLSSPATYSIAFVFNAQDSANPGSFPNAAFVFQTTGTCPTGTQPFSGKLSPPSGIVNCSSPAVAIVSLHSGKYVIFVTGIDIPTNSPTLLILVQN